MSQSAQCSQGVDSNSGSCTDASDGEDPDTDRDSHDDELPKKEAP